MATIFGQLDDDTQTKFELVPGYQTCHTTYGDDLQEEEDNNDVIVLLLIM